jgi:fucose permease
MRADACRQRTDQQPCSETESFSERNRKETPMSISMAAAVAFSGVFALGVIFSVLGSVKLKLQEVLKINDAQAGTLISALMFSSLIAVLIIGPLTDALGYKIIAIAGFALGGICIWMLALAPSYVTTLIACLFLGIAAMCVNTVGNTLGPTVLFDGQDPARASNMLNVFFGLGAFLTPLIIANFLGKMGYKVTVGIIGTVLFVPIFYAVGAEFPEAGEGFMLTKALGLLTNPAVLVSGLALFCYIALESSMGGFVTTYLKSFDLSDKQAGTLLSGFWISLMAARLIAALTLTNIDPSMVVPVLALGAVIAIAIMVTAKSTAAGIAGTLLAGLTLGPIFPTLVGVAFAKSGAIAAGTAGSVFGLIFAIGLFGGIIVPTLIGKYAAALNIRQSLKIALGVAVALIGVSAVLWLAIPNV